jgi:hypothetical protein
MDKNLIGRDGRTCLSVCRRDNLGSCCILRKGCFSRLLLAHVWQLQCLVSERFCFFLRTGWKSSECMWTMMDFEFRPQNSRLLNGAKQSSLSSDFPGFYWWVPVYQFPCMCFQQIICSIVDLRASLGLQTLNRSTSFATLASSCFAA